MKKKTLNASEMGKKSARVRLKNKTKQEIAAFFRELREKRFAKPSGDKV